MDNNMSIVKKFGNASISPLASEAVNSPEVFVIMPNNVLVPTSFQGVRYKPLVPSSSVDLSNPASLIATVLPDGCGIGLDVTTGSAILIANCPPGPAFDLIAGTNIQTSSTVNISGSGSYVGQIWTAKTILNVF
jgi:hypothetical protein